MKSAQVESDAIHLHDLCTVTFFLYTRWIKMMRRHNSYSYLFEILRGQKSFSLLSAEQRQNGTIMACLCTYSMDLKSYCAT